MICVKPSIKGKSLFITNKINNTNKLLVLKLLVRWNHSELGHDSPAIYSIAEQ